MKREFITAVIVVSFLRATVVLDGWSEDVRLTYRGFEIHPQVIARNDTVHVTWEQIAGPQHISYMRSLNAGLTWWPLLNLEAWNHYGSGPNMSLGGDTVFVAWSDVDTSRIYGIVNIGYCYSPDGDGWSAQGYVFDTLNGQSRHDEATAFCRDSIYVVYFAAVRDSTGSFPFRFLYSSDLGQSWSQELTVAHALSDAYLRISKCGRSLYVVWTTGVLPPHGLWEVMTVVSHDGGQSWSDVIYLSAADSAIAQAPFLACDQTNGQFGVGWMDFAESGGYPGDLFLRITTDGGSTWGPECRATHHHGVAAPALALAGDTIWAVWSDHDPAYGFYNLEICFTRSTDRGITWSPYERLTNAWGMSSAPWISYDRGKLHVVWYDNNLPPDSGLDIYYKRFDPETDAIDERPAPLPQGTNLSAYPNPFNSSTIITYCNLKGGEIRIFDIKGQLIRTIFTGGENEGRIIWDARDAEGNKVSSGIYFARVRTPSSSKSIKLIYLK